jgi:hypothetical protein
MVGHDAVQDKRLCRIVAFVPAVRQDKAVAARPGRH